MLLYSVTIHEMDDETVESEPWLESKYRVPCPFARVRILASSKRKAAAKAYVAVLGRARGATARPLRRPPEDDSHDDLDGA